MNSIFEVWLLKPIPKYKFELLGSSYNIWYCLHCYESKYCEFKIIQFEFSREREKERYSLVILSMKQLICILSIDTNNISEI